MHQAFFSPEFRLQRLSTAEEHVLRFHLNDTGHIRMTQESRKQKLKTAKLPL
jgi:hypothetical protein